MIPETAVPAVPVVEEGEEDEEEVDDEDVEASLDEILKERMVVEEERGRRGSGAGGPVGGLGTGPPKQPDEFVCQLVFPSQALEPAGRPEEEAVQGLRVNSPTGTDDRERR